MAGVLHGHSSFDLYYVSFSMLIGLFQYVIGLFQYAINIMSSSCAARPFLFRPILCSYSTKYNMIIRHIHVSLMSLVGLFYVISIMSLVGLFYAIIIDNMIIRHIHGVVAEASDRTLLTLNRTLLTLYVALLTAEALQYDHQTYTWRGGRGLRGVCVCVHVIVQGVEPAIIIDNIIIRHIQNVFSDYYRMCSLSCSMSLSKVQSLPLLQTI